jgi:hypothetical protein
VVFDPDQDTLAVQAVALVVDQVSVVELPKLMVDGLAEMVRVGAAALTVIVADEEAEPPGPVQVRVYMVVLVGETDSVPLVVLLPLQPLEAVQEVALAELQVKVDELPLVIVEGLAERLTVGAAALTVTVAELLAEPPGPVQVRV